MNRFISTLIWVVLFSSNLISSSVPELLSKDASYLYDMGKQSFYIMECGKLTAKLRDAVPVCFIVDGKEVKRYKNIEIPDEVKKLPFKAFDFNVPLTGAITFKISFEPGVLPEVWPEKRQRKSRQRKRRKLRYRRM